MCVCDSRVIYVCRVCQGEAGADGEAGDAGRPGPKVMRTM